MWRLRNQRRVAFTLVALLVVIAIMAVLLTLIDNTRAAKSQRESQAGALCQQSAAISGGFNELRSGE